MARRRRKKRRGSLLRVLFFTMLALLVATGGAGAGFLAGIVRDLPPLDDIRAPKPSLTSFIYSADGQVIAELHKEQDRVPLRLDEKLPEHVKNAFIAIEDHKFYSHRGFDLRAIARAVYVIATTGDIQGGSTITQQLAKNAFTNQERTIRRKLKELILAVQLERTYSKDEILNMYLNWIFFGHNAYGLKSAADLYFGKEVSELTLAEAALLAGLLQQPNYYSPYANPEAAKARRAVVLDKMAEYGFIGPEEAEAAKEEPIELAGLNRPAEYKAPWFVDYVTQQLIDRYGEELVFTGGLRVYTTINMKVQQALEEAFRQVLDERWPPGEEGPEAAAVFIDVRNGHIVAMMGGREHQGVMDRNRAMKAQRQPGSAFKPLAVYTPAIDLGYTPATVVDDFLFEHELPNGDTWVPKNYDDTYRGLVPIRQAIMKSINVVAAKVLLDIGVDTGVQYAMRMGIESLVLEGTIHDRVPAIALGGLTLGVTPFEMARAYGTLATLGVRVEPIAITKVVDKDGNVLEENRAHKELVLDPATAYVVTDMLKSVVTGGTGRNARLEGWPAAGKTGTTENQADVWWVGYTPRFVGAVWVGYDIPRKMEEGVWGGTVAAPIWRITMEAAHEGLTPTDFPPPSNIIKREVCLKSGKLPSELCPGEYIAEEIFIEGTEPTETCDVHVEVSVCEVSGKLATEACPPSTVVTRVFLQRPEPWEPYVDPETEETYRPLDADEEAPKEYCDVHTGSSPDVPGSGTIGEDEIPADAVVVDMIARQFEFVPNEITVRRGDTVVLRVTSTDVDHGIAIPGYRIRELIPAGETVIIKFEADRPGLFVFYCYVACGPGHDKMVGKILVEP